MKHDAMIIDGMPAAAGCCDILHLDEDGNLLDLPAEVRLILSTPTGRRFVDLCNDHDGLVGSDLARWSHPLDAAQQLREAAMNRSLTPVLEMPVLRQSPRRAA